MGWISSRVGMRITTPLNSSLFNDSQSGTARLVEISRFLVANWRETLLFFDVDDVVHLERAGRNVDLAAIDLDVAVRNHLPRGGAGVRKTEVINHVVEARLQNLQHLFARDATAFQRLFVNAAELALHQTVIVTELLLLDQAEAVIGVLAAGLGAMHAGTVIAAFEIFRRAEDRDAETAADANAGTCITSHKFMISNLRVD